MNITLELFASLMKFLPEGSTMHATELEVADGYTLNNLIDDFEIPREQAHIVLVNGHFKWEQRTAVCGRPLNGHL